MTYGYRFRNKICKVCGLERHDCKCNSYTEEYNKVKCKYCGSTDIVLGDVNVCVTCSKK